MATILIGEDVPDISDVLARLFRGDGHDVHTSDTGADTLRNARSLPIDLLVMNPALPGLDGLEICRRLRADPHTTSLPILLLSVHQYPAERDAAYQAGADDYLGKPFSSDDLLGRARALLSRERAVPGRPGGRTTAPAPLTPSP